MKRALSLLLVLCMILSLVPAGIAEEEAFAEETFFEEEGFGGEEFFFGDEEFFDESLFEDEAADAFAPDAEEPAEAADEEEVIVDADSELEDRSIVSLETDQSEWDPEAEGVNLAEEYWKVEPRLRVDYVYNKKGVQQVGQVRLTWVQPNTELPEIPVLNKKKQPTGAMAKPTKLPSGVKYYVYEVNEETGVATQVGKPIAAAKKNLTVVVGEGDEAQSYTGIGATVTLKKLPDGEKTYFVRAEMQTVANKKAKTYAETYGLSSELRKITVDDGSWKKVSKAAVKQIGTDATLTWKGSKLIGDPEDWDLDVQTSGEGPNPVITSVTGTGYLVTMSYTMSGQTFGPFPVTGGASFGPNENLTYNASTNEYSIGISLIGAPAGLKMSFKVTPYRNDVAGKTAAPKALKPSTDVTVGWKGVSELTGEQIGTEAKALISWKVNAMKLPGRYTIAGAASSSTIEWVADPEDGTGTYKAVPDKKGKTAVTDAWVNLVDKNGNSAYVPADGTIPSGGYAEVFVEVTLKDAASAKVTVTPQELNAKGKWAKGTKATTAITLSDYWRAKPVITFAQQTGNLEATIRFHQNKAPRVGEQLIVKGFKSALTLMVQKDGTVAYAPNTNFLSVKSIPEDVDGEPRMTYEVVGLVKKAGKAKFTVQPQYPNAKGKMVKGTKSATSTVAIAAAPKASAMRIWLGAVKDGNVTVTFRSVRPDAAYFNVSLVSADSFTSDTGYAERYSKQDGNEILAVPGQDVYTADFSGVDENGTYSVFVETITADGGRVIDKITSLTYGEEALDAALAAMTDEELAALQAALNGAAQTTVKATGEPAFVDSIGVDAGTVLDEGDWEYSVNNGAAQPYDKEEGIPDIVGEANISFRKVVGGVPGEWSSPVTVTAYPHITAMGFDTDGDDTAAKGDTVELAPWSLGGLENGEKTFTLYKKYNDGTAEEVESKKVTAEGISASAIFSVELPEDGTYKFYYTVTDEGLEGDPDDLTAELEEGDYLTITVSKILTEAPFVYEILERSGSTGTVSVIDYTGSDAEVEVKATLVKNGATYTVVQITGAGEGESYKGAFENNTTLTSIVLPNAIEIIGENAFKGCTNLSTMSCK